MEKILTTLEEFWYKNTGKSINQEEYSAMFEFAKFHVEAALKTAAKTRKNGFYDSSKEEELIINSYPLENIK